MLQMPIAEYTDCSCQLFTTDETPSSTVICGCQLRLKPINHRILQLPIFKECQNTDKTYAAAANFFKPQKFKQTLYSAIAATDISETPTLHFHLQFRFAFNQQNTVNIVFCSCQLLESLAKTREHYIFSCQLFITGKNRQHIILQLSTSFITDKNKHSILQLPASLITYKNPTYSILWRCQLLLSPAKTDKHRILQLPTFYKRQKNDKHRSLELPTSVITGKIPNTQYFEASIVF